MEIARMIDHTLLKPTATEAQIQTLCKEAIEQNFASVCINPSYVSLCASLLKDKTPKVCTVIGFPLGATSTQSKVEETKIAIADGAEEVDMVIHIGALIEGRLDYVLKDIKAVVAAAHAENVLVKVIVETVLLNEDQKIAVSKIVKESGADFIKTSTGFAGGGATVADVALMRQYVGPEMGIKAAGGVRNYDDAVAMIKAGATRIGTSSGVQILSGQTSQTDY